MAAAMAHPPNMEEGVGLGLSDAKPAAAAQPHDTEPQHPTAPVTPPPTDESSKDHASNASDLSELELDDEDDEEEIYPDHYYDGGKIPVFKPVSEERYHDQCKCADQTYQDYGSIPKL